MQSPFVNLDIEPTNRCNAHCYFCPRDQTPHQGLMTPEVFAKSLSRALEYEAVARERFGSRMKVNLCGLGEPLLNKHTPDFARQLREAGFETSVSTNGSLLDEARGRALLAAGIDGIEINVGEEGDDYEQIYGLGFEKTCDNVVRFAEMAHEDGDRCQVRIVLVNHRRSSEHMAKMTSFWRERGLKHFLGFNIMNRGGTLFVDEMQYTSFSERAEAERMLRARDANPVCSAPFVLLFIGYDGQYYLCCSDWKKEVAFGSVFDTSFMAIMGDKLERAESRQPICKNCNHDPVNRLTEALRDRASGDIDDAAVELLLEELIDHDRTSRTIVRDLEDFAAHNGDTSRVRRLIPLSVEPDPAG
jgi:MoaA/NifB/PqqE/SkfB family radical SAM enzyme